VGTFSGGLNAFPLVVQVVLSDVTGVPRWSLPALVCLFDLRGSLAPPGERPHYG
jgi:hypothetical protein